MESGCRTGRELAAVWRELQEEHREACHFLGKEVEGPAAAEVGGIGDGATTGATRKLLARAREEWRFDCFEQCLALQGREAIKGRAISSWKERDKLCTAFLLQSPGPHSKLTSPVMAEALATLLCLPSRVCMDRLGEKVGNARVDRFGERVICAVLPGGHNTDRHNAMEQEIASLCSYAGVPAECEPYGLFGALLPQEALHRLQRNQHQQVLRPDLRLEVPPTSVRVTGGRRPPAPRRGEQAAAPPAPVPTQYSGSYIAEIKVIGKGASSHYKSGLRAQRGVDKRAKEIPGAYLDKAVAMDRAMGEEGEGPCQRRLAELPLLGLCWGAYGEGSPGVHVLVSLLAACRVRSLALQGKDPSPHQLGLEVAVIRRRLSTAAVRANNVLLLQRAGQIGEGSGLASKRRSWQRREERRMLMEREADWLVATTGQELVRRGRYWGR